MAFDPTLPANNSPVAAAELRAQFNALHDEITTIPQGPPGPPGADGPPFADAVVDAVNTLNPGDPASVAVSFDGTNVHFTFSLPRGNDGATGANGNDGGPGPQGVPGPPGEVTNAALATALAGTSNNSNAVPTLDTPFANDPPTLADLETMRAAYNTLVQALRR